MRQFSVLVKVSTSSTPWETNSWYLFSTQKQQGLGAFSGQEEAWCLSLISGEAFSYEGGCDVTELYRHCVITENFKSF